VLFIRIAKQKRNPRGFLFCVIQKTPVSVDISVVFSDRIAVWFTHLRHEISKCQHGLIAVSRPTLEVVIVRLDILGQINNLASFELLGAIQNDGITIMISTLVVASQSHSTNVLATFGLIGTGYLIFRENRFLRTLGNAGTAIDAGIRINIHPGVLLNRLTWDDALDRAYLDATTVAQTKAGNDVGHAFPP